VVAPNPRARGDLARIADALERIAGAVEGGRARKRERRPEIEVSETDRAAARAVARKMGLHVRSAK
jgi:hypothetical protein